jgi:hypothetical protein
MTSNLGAEEFAKKKASIGFSSDADIDVFAGKDWTKVIWESTRTCEGFHLTRTSK